MSDECEPGVKCLPGVSEEDLRKIGTTISLIRHELQPCWEQSQESPARKLAIEAVIDRSALIGSMLDRLVHEMATLRTLGVIE